MNTGYLNASSSGISRENLENIEITDIETFPDCIINAISSCPPIVRANLEVISKSCGINSQLRALASKIEKDIGIAV